MPNSVVLVTDEAGLISMGAVVVLGAGLFLTTTAMPNSVEVVIDPVVLS